MKDLFSLVPYALVIGIGLVVASNWIVDRDSSPPPAPPVETAEVSEVENVVTVLSETKLPDHLQSEFDKWVATKPAFAAYYISSDAKVSGVGANFVTQADADTRARVQCGVRAGRPCTVYARIAPPEGYQPIELQPTFMKVWKTYVSDTEDGKFTAWAMNGWSGRGKSINAPTRQAAEEQAMTLCEQESQEAQKYMVPSMKEAAEAEELFQCHLVGLKQP